MRSVFVGLFALAIASPAVIAQKTFEPTTTLAIETGNNTSAPNSIYSYTSGHAPTGNVSKEPMRDLLYAGASTKVYAALMGWFGKGGHIAVGYDSRTAAQVQKQVEDMQSRGIDGAILAWYGKNSYENTTALELKRQAEAHPGFAFAIMIDHGTLQWDSLGLNATDALIAQMNYIADTYYSSPAYMKIDGRPVLVEFGLELVTIDWVKVGSSVRGNPMIIFRNPNGWSKLLSAGAYAWEPDKADTSYLDYFYAQSKSYPAQQTFGGVSPSFNDSLATWSAQRYADPQCGQTWLKKAADSARYFSAANQLRFIQIATWNDYEEGSTVESGIDNCLSVSASASGNTLSWSLSGNGSESTIDHYTVFASRDGVNLMPIADLPAGARSYDFAQSGLANGTYALYVKAVGKSSIMNHTSAAATVTLGSVPTAPPDYALSSPANAVTVTAAQPASLDLMLQPKNGFADTVTFSCSGLPVTSQCSFAPASVQANGKDAVGTKLTIRTTQSASMAVPGLAGLVLLSSLFFSRPQRRRVIGCLALGVTAAFLTACGGGAQPQSSAPATSQQATSPTQVVITVIGTPSNRNLPTRTMQLTVTLK